MILGERDLRFGVGWDATRTAQPRDDGLQRGRHDVSVDADAEERLRGADAQFEVSDRLRVGAGAQARAAAYLEMRIGGQRTLFGVGMDTNIVSASIKAVLSAVLRAGLAIDAEPQRVVATAASNRA